MHALAANIETYNEMWTGIGLSQRGNDDLVDV